MFGLITIVLAQSLFFKDTTIHYPVEESRVDNLAVVNSHCYPLSCITVIVGILTLSVFPKNTAAQYVQYGYRTSSLKIIIRRYCKLSYAINTTTRRKKTGNRNYTVLNTDQHFFKTKLLNSSLSVTPIIT